MSGGGNRQTVTQQIDPWTQGRMQDLWSMGSEYVQNTPYAAPPPSVAGFSPMQLQAQDYLQQTFGQGAPGMAEAQQAAGIAGGIAQGGNVPQVNPQMLSAQYAGMPGDVNAERVMAGNAAAGMGAYRDPYEDQVVGAAMSDIDRQRQLAQVGNASSATMSGAFGGDRHAILEAETNRGFGDVAARTAAQLRSQGFNRAADLAQMDASRGLQAGMANQGAGLQAGLANQANARAMGQFNAGLGLQAGMANQSAGLQGDMANQNAFFQGQNQQLQGAGLLSSFGGDMFNRAAGTADIFSRMGAQQQNQSQAEMDDDVARFYEQRGYPMQQVQFLQSLLTGFPAGMNQTMTGGTNRGAGFLGGAATGAGIGGAFGPVGAGIGAGLGGLIGLF